MLVVLECRNEVDAVDPCDAERRVPIERSIEDRGWLRLACAAAAVAAADSLVGTGLPNAILGAGDGSLRCATIGPVDAAVVPIGAPFCAKRLDFFADDVAVRGLDGNTA